MLLRCNVVVHDNGDGTSTVETLNLSATLDFLSDDPAMVILVQEADSILRGAVDNLNRSEDRRQGA